MRRKHETDWKAEILMSSQHGPGIAQEMIDHQVVTAPCQLTLMVGVSETMKRMIGTLVPDGTAEVRSGFPLTGLHFSLLVTRRKN